MRWKKWNGAGLKIRKIQPTRNKRGTFYVERRSDQIRLIKGEGLERRDHDGQSGKGKKLEAKR